MPKSKTLLWDKAKNPESVKFEFKMRGRPCEGFVIQAGKEVKAYLNRCPHAGSPLDFGDNEFFTDDKKWLLCRAHGAVFEPKTGLCIGGPCAGESLSEIQVESLGRDRLKITLPTEV
jgi:nitrite reductase/ring-hydroxylating ferredoxin subunit